MIEKQVNNTKLRLIRGDVTDQEVDAFVFYARHDLEPGAGFGTAIQQRGGLAVKKELEAIGSIETGEAVITTAGEMKAEKIIHACGPRFQEEEEEQKLRDTMVASLRRAEENDVKTLAFPPMGTGFYGIPLELCSKVMLEEVTRHLKGETKLEQVDIVVMDGREQKPFEEAFQKL